MTKPSKRRRSELERLVDLTVLGPTHPEVGSCWLFTGTTTPYGRIAKAQGQLHPPARLELLRGPIPEGKELHHRCGVYACSNPEHLEPVTHAENQRHLRKTHCKHGHQLSGGNLRIGPNGTRACRACIAAAQAFRERSSARPLNGLLDPTSAIPHSVRYVNRSFPRGRAVPSVKLDLKLAPSTRLSH